MPGITSEKKMLDIECLTRSKKRGKKKKPGTGGVGLLALANLI